MSRQLTDWAILKREIAMQCGAPNEDELELPEWFSLLRLPELAQEESSDGLEG